MPTFDTNFEISDVKILDETASYDLAMEIEAAVDAVFSRYTTAILTKKTEINRKQLVDALDGSVIKWLAIKCEGNQVKISRLYGANRNTDRKIGKQCALNFWKFRNCDKETT